MFLEIFEEEKRKKEFNELIKKCLNVSKEEQENIFNDNIDKLSEGARFAFRVIVLGENYDDIVSALAEDFKFSVISDLNKYRAYYQNESYEKVLDEKREVVKKEVLRETKVKDKKKKSENLVNSKEILEIVNSLIKLNQEKKNTEVLIGELESKLKARLKESETLNLDIGVLRKEKNKITIEMEL